MISIGVGAHVSSKALRDKGGCAPVRRAAGGPLNASKTCGQASCRTRPAQRAHRGLSQYGVVQQLWAGSTVRRVATVRLQHSASVVLHSSGTATALNDATARHHTADGVQ
jgi:hypothetical protein